VFEGVGSVGGSLGVGRFGGGGVCCVRPLGVFKIPPKTWMFFSNNELDAINFIDYINNQ
jgi:hypothetical protein